MRPAARPAPDAPTGTTGPDGSAATPEAPTGGGLFGRSLVYVVVWSLELVIATVASPITVHIMAPAQFGALASAIALYQVLIIFAVLGLDQVVLLRSGADPRAGRRLLAAGTVIAALASALLLVSAPLWGGALGFHEQEGLLAATALWVLPGSLVALTMATLVAQDRLVPFTIVGALSALGGPAAGVVALLTISPTATTYIGAVAAMRGLAAVVGLIAARPSWSGVVKFRELGGALRIGLPLAFGYVSNFVLNAGDRIVLQQQLGFTEVGRYQIAYTVGSVVVLLLTFTHGSWLPRIAEIADEGQRWALATASRDQLYRILAPVIIGVTLASPAVLTVVAPDSFRQEALLPIVFLVALCGFPVAASGASERIIVTAGRARTIVIVATASALVNVGLNLLLIPPLGLIGSALATLASFALIAALQVRLLPRGHVWRRPDRRVVAVALLCCGVAAASLLVPWNDATNLVRFGVAVVCLPWFFWTVRSAKRRLDAPAAAPVAGAAA